MWVNYAPLEVGEVVNISNIQSEVNSLTPDVPLACLCHVKLLHLCSIYAQQHTRSLHINRIMPSDNNILGLRAQILG
jgi:hypothetical protein